MGTVVIGILFWGFVILVLVGVYYQKKREREEFAAMRLKAVHIKCPYCSETGRVTLRKQVETEQHYKAGRTRPTGTTQRTVSQYRCGQCGSSWGA